MASLGMAGWLSLGGSLLNMYGAQQAARASKTAGERAKVIGEVNALEYERQAGIAIALSQRQALEEKRQADLAASRSLAVAAASGGGVSDPTIVRILANTKGMGTYRANVALYEGEERARQFRMAAKGELLGGSQALEAGLDRARAYDISGIGNAVKSAAGLYAKYGGGGPEAASPYQHGDAALISPDE